MKQKLINIRVSASELFLIEEIAIAVERGNRSATLVKCLERYAKSEHPEIYAKYIESRDKENKAIDNQPIKRFRETLKELKESNKPENQDDYD